MSKSEGREQMQKVIQQMRGVRSDRGIVLRRMLNENEQATRETVSAELEVKNYKTSQKRLREEISKLTRELKQAKSTKVKAQDMVKAARSAAAKLASQNASLGAAANKLQKEVSGLKSNSGKLQKSVNHLEATRDTLNADVKRLKELRTKYLSDLAKFRA